VNRRKFIWDSGITGFATWLGIHEILGGCTPGNKDPVIAGTTKILGLDLVTATPLSELKNFYTGLLELPLVAEQKDRLTIRAGETIINFIHKNDNTASFYHFAFNIPENKIIKAREWQLKRTALSATPSHMTDTGYPEDIRHFRGWNAHSVFFWDPAGNLVEYIARHDLKNDREGEFSSKDLLCASEIAIIVNETEPVADDLKSTFNLQQYKGGDENFRAIGDENCLLLVIKKGRVWEGHTPVSRTPATIETVVTIQSGEAKSWNPVNYPFTIKSKV